MHRRVLALTMILFGLVVMTVTMGQTLAAGTGCEDGTMNLGPGGWLMNCGPNDCPDDDPCAPYTYTHPGTGNIVTMCQCWSNGLPYSPLVTSAECKTTMFDQAGSIGILCAKINCASPYDCEDQFTTDSKGVVNNRWCSCQ